MSLATDLAAKIRDLFAAGAKPDIAQLQALESSVEQSLTAARADVSAAIAEHEQHALELIADPESAAAKKSRAKVDAARWKVSELQLALVQVTQRREDAERAAADAQRETEWKRVRELLEQRTAAAARLQKALAAVVKENEALKALTEEAWQALPVKPAYGRPPTFTKQSIAGRLDLYLFGLSGGALGHGANAYVESQKPDMVAQVKDANTMVLGLVEQRATAPRAESAGV